MRGFFEKNKVFLAIVGVLAVGAAVYFGFGKNERGGIILTSTLAPSLTECLSPSEVMVTKVIDGDTVVVEGGEHVRLLGIDADESGYPCYQPAKSRLEELILNKKVRLEKDETDTDQYKRCLRYIFLHSQNINVQLVKEGFAVARFYEPDVKYKDEISAAEKVAIEGKIGCKWPSSGFILSDDEADGEIVEDNDEKIDFQWEKLAPELTGLKVIAACQAENYYGKELIVEGKIASTNRSKTNTVFLNFEKPYPEQCFTAVIFSSDQYKFIESPENHYSNKTIRVKGKIEQYQGKPEIILKDASQIEAGERYFIH